jgi:TM2 domain-containing membrane protein YozV
MSETPTIPPPPPRGGGGGKDPVAALLLHLLVLGGTGYLYIGQRTKGIVMIVIFFAVGFPTCFAASFAISILSAIDAYQQALQLAEGREIGEWTFFAQTRSAG